MPYLKLLEKGSQKTHRVDSTDAAVGRDPAAGVFVEGDAAKTVSGRHARFFLGDDGKWYVEDTGSRNGTFIGSRKIAPGTRHQLTAGDCVGLGLTGTQLIVEEAVGRAFAATMLEAQPAPVAFGTVPMRRSEAIRAGLHDPAGPQSSNEVRVVLRAVHTGMRMVGQADRVTMGRALECLIRVEGEMATSVSRVHADIVVLGEKPHIRDAGSRHGTFVNGKKIESAVLLKHGDLVMLGPGGPTFTVDEVAVMPPGTKQPAAPVLAIGKEPPGPTPTDGNPIRNKTDDPPAKSKMRAPAREPDEVFHAESPTPPLARDAIRTSIKRVSGPVVRLARSSLAALGQVSPGSSRIRVVAWSAIGVAAVTIVILLYARRQKGSPNEQMDVASAGVEQRASALDSVRNAAAAEAVRMRASLDSATTAAAPQAVLDSLRNALADADRRRRDTSRR